MGICFVPECKSGYPSQRREYKTLGKRIPSLFSCKTQDLKKWNRAIPRADRPLTGKDKVCELHFNVNDIERYYSQKFPDGTTQVLERGKPSLKPGVIPTIFPNLPDRFSKKSEKRKSPIKRVPPAKKIKVEENLVIDTVPSNMQESDEFNLSDNIQLVKLPSHWWAIHSFPKYVACARWNDACIVDRKVIVKDDNSIKMSLHDIDLQTEEKVSCIQDVSYLLQRLDDYTACSEATNSTDCRGYISMNKHGRNSTLCEVCRNKRKQKLRLVRRQHVSKLLYSRRNLYQRVLSTKRKCIRLKEKVNKLKNQVNSLKSKCAVVEMEAIKHKLCEFPVPQQEAVGACIEAAKRKDGTGQRYTVQWIYECLLIRIKGRKVYEHLRSHKILALPSAKTLSRYIKKIKGAYGFQSTVFNLKEKAAHMDKFDRRGTLLLDEMKVSSSIEFNAQTLKVQGFTDLEEYTEKHDTYVKGDHVLVFMFQPFKGKWIQTLACFLSKTAVTGTKLCHLIAECIILLENSGYFVDVVTSDGATWNRSMWKQFGVSLQNVSCSHIYDENRRLWFISDFPHLVKNIRNAITDKKNLMTPDGPVKLQFWETVLQADNPKTYSLKICPKLKPYHVHPQNYQKMNVGMAFQFFSNSVSCGMEYYKDKYEGLCHSDGCILFIKRLDSLIDAMNSRTPLTALRRCSQTEKVIQNFLEYVCEWEKFAKQQNSNFISDLTCYGLKITLKSTLEVLEFLTSECDFKYLMTARLNQDSLERFFSMMRNACGSNDHPDSTMFLQVYRLLSTYSLVKPPRGSNITGGEIVQFLFNSSDISYVKEDQEIFNEKLHTILQQGGYFAWRAQRLTKCVECSKTLTSSEEKGAEISKLIDLKEKTLLSRPSNAMYTLVRLVEESTMNVTSKGPLHVDSFMDVLNDLEGRGKIPLLGCLNHQLELSEGILKMCLITGLHLICKRANYIDSFKAAKARKLRKFSKLS